MYLFFVHFGMGLSISLFFFVDVDYCLIYLGVIRKPLHFSDSNPQQVYTNHFLFQDQNQSFLIKGDKVYYSLV